MQWGPTNHGVHCFKQSNESTPYIYMHGYICLAKKGFDLEGNFVEMQKMLEHLYNLHVFIYVNEIVVEQTHVNGGIL